MDTRTDLSRSVIGQDTFALDTPALLVDLDVMEANIARIVATCRAHGVAWRPHSKAHKTPEIDRKSTRLNSSHVAISYAVFCLKKKKKKRRNKRTENTT